MSHIFDALQRSEAERTGDPADALSLATELLKIAESDASTPVAEPVPEAMVPAPAMPLPICRVVRESLRSF